MSIRALHISHTDIRSDSRILKEMTAISKLPGLQVVGIGVEDSGGAPYAAVASKYKVETLDPLTRRLKKLPRPVYLLIAFLELTTRLIGRGFRYRPHVVHCHDTLVLPAGIILKFLTGAKVVYDAHELESQKNGQTAFLSLATLMIERVCWPWIDALVSVSNSIVSWYEKSFSRRPTAVVLNSPVFASQTGSGKPIKSNHLRDAFGIDADALIFVYVGILSRGRGIELLLEVFSEVDCRAHIVLMGYGELEKTITQFTVKHKNIHLHPPVAHSLVVEYASGADVGLCLIENVSLSDYLCLPNKLFEYSFAGIPVLASDFPEIRRVVEQYALGDVCAPKREAVRSAVLSWVQNPSRASAEPKDLRPLSWDEQARKLIALYQDLMPSISRQN